MTEESHTGPAYSWESSGTAPRWAGLWVLLLVGVAVIRVRWGWGDPRSPPLSPPSVLASSTHHNLPPKWDQSGLRHLLLVLENWFQGAVNRIKVELAPCFPFVHKETFMLKSRVLSFIPQTFLEHLPCARPCFQDIGHTDKSLPVRPQIPNVMKRWCCYFRF